jgi:hypothetical protein
MCDDFPEHDGAADNDHGKGQVSIGIKSRFHDNILSFLNIRQSDYAVSIIDLLG